MTSITWTELTDSQRAYLDTLARAAIEGDEWVYTWDKPEFNTDDFLRLAEFRLAGTGRNGMYDRITAAGLAVWQQGQQAAAPPRTVWVARCGDDIISVNDADDSAMHACCTHAGVELVWERIGALSDGTKRLTTYHDVYSVEEWRVLP